MAVLTVLALLGNILVCIAVYRNTRLRTTTNLYIIALAVSDLLSAIFVIPFTVGALISGGWPFGKNVCRMNAFFSVFVTYVSPVTMGLTAFNRFMRICKSDQQYRRFFSRRKSRIWLASTWSFVALFIMFSRLGGPHEVQFHPGYALCFNSYLSISIRAIRISIIVGFLVVLPLTVSIFSYREVFKKIRQHNMGAAQGLQAQARTPGISSHEIRISKSLFPVVFAFMLCWVPFWVVTILTRLRIVANMPRNVELLCTFCLNLSNAINPLIYAGMNPLFKKEFIQILRCGTSNLVQEISVPSSEPQNARVEAATDNNNNN